MNFSNEVLKYFRQGRTLDMMLKELAAAGEGLLPVYPRVLIGESLPVLLFELALRRGPQWRCNGCGWLPAVAWTRRAPECPHCAGKEKAFPTMQPWKGDTAEMAGHWRIEGRWRDWYLATARRCGMPEMGNGEVEISNGESETQHDELNED